MDNKDKLYWEIRDRLDQVGYHTYQRKITELIEEQKNVLIGVIKEFTEKYG